MHYHQEEFSRNNVMHTILGNDIVSIETFNFLCGDLLGFGISRFVFEYAIDRRYVIKFDTSQYNANVMEKKVWDEVQYHPKASKWFAPVIQMSRCGRVMLQRKARMDVAHSKYPKKIPAFLTDRKYKNYGFIGNQLVCVDYGGFIIDKGFSTKMTLANWWEE